MDASPIEQWLQRRFRREASTCVVLSPLAMLAGLFVLFLTFWLGYVAALFGVGAVDVLVSLFSNSHFKVRHVTLLGLASAFLVALIIGHLRTKPFYFAEQNDATYEEVRTLADRGGVFRRPAMMPLFFPMGSSRMITDVLFTGPRLLFGGWAMLRESARLRAVNTAELAQVLAVLAARDGRVTNEEIVALFPGSDFIPLMQALSSLPGVVTLELGFSLTAEFRSELRALG